MSSTMKATSSALLTDLYQLTMARAYHELGMQGTAVFELFVAGCREVVASSSRRASSRWCSTCRRCGSAPTTSSFSTA